jgi:hypothetical protein
MAEHAPYFVYQATSLAIGDWVYNPHLICPRLVRGLAPTLDQAALRYAFGKITRDTENENVYWPRLELQGGYVRIIVPSLEIDWAGYVLNEDLQRWPQETVEAVDRIVGGNQSFQVTGLEWFLTRQTVNSCVIYPDVRIDRAIGYNQGFGLGRGVTYETRANKDTRGAFFAADKDHAELWSAREIVEDLLTNHHPRDSAGNPQPCEFTIHADSLPYLEWYYPSVEVEGKNLWQALNDVINMRRGLVWWLEYSEPLNECLLRVSSIATAPIVFDDAETLPANASQVTIPDLDEYAWSPVITTKGDRKWGQVVCRGARRRAVFTVSPAAENLEKSWTDAEETAYKAAAGDPDPGINDRFRQALRFERVFTTLHIPTDWDGRCNDGSALGESGFACPYIEQSTGSEVGGEKLYMPGLRLLPTMPIKVGWDYADATDPTPRDPDLVESEWQRPFAMIDVGDDDWRFAHELNVNADENGDERLTSYHLRVLQETPGLQILPGGGMPHSLALNSFDPDVDAASEHAPEVDYNNMRCTVCGEWDAYCEGRWPETPPAGDKPLQTLYVSIGERARHDWLAEKTIFDIQDGALELVNTGGPLRDDRDLCIKVARIAWEWYGIARAELQLSMKTTEQPAGLGDLITTVGSGEALHDINSVVTQITHALEGGGTSLTTGFAEIDFEALV